MNQITVRQTACFCAISMLALKLIELPSLLYKQGLNGGIFIGVIMTIIDFLILLVFLIAKKKFPNYSLYDLLKKFLGTIVAKIIYVFMFVFFIIKILTLTNEAIFFMKMVVDEDYYVTIFLITFLPVLSSMVFHGLNATAKTCEFGYIFILMGIIVCLFMSNTYAVFSKIGPIFNNGFLKTINVMFNMSFWFSDFLFITIISDKIEWQKGAIKKVFITLGFVYILLFLLYFVYFRLFKVTAFLHRNMIADITQYNKEIGNVGNLDIISILAYMFVIFLQGGIYFNCLNIILNKLFNNKNKINSLFIINLIIILLQYFVFFNLNKIIDFIFNYFKYFNLFILIVIPIFYLFLILFYKEKKHDDKYKKYNKKT